MNTSTTPEPSALQAQAAENASVRWLDPYGIEHTALATSALLDSELYLAQQLRTGNHYPRQKNYHGFFYFSQVGHHVWHESLLEAGTLLWLDLHEDILAVTSQPMELRFSDGSTHIPDVFTLHGDHRQVLYDVKPIKFMTEDVLEQFAKTRALCKQVGWGYEVHSELPQQVRINLGWVGAFRHPHFHPGADAAARLLAALSTPLPVLAAARALDIGYWPYARSAIYHLVAMQVLSIDLTKPLSDTTLVARKESHV